LLEIDDNCDILFLVATWNSVENNRRVNSIALPRNDPLTQAFVSLCYVCIATDRTTQHKTKINKINPLKVRWPVCRAFETLDMLIVKLFLNSVARSLRSFSPN